MAGRGIIAQYFAFLRHNKRWLLVPVAILVLLLCALLLVTHGSPLAPLIYTIF
jgi:drug/metabolite transporter superfamily protein YnfA